MELLGDVGHVKSRFSPFGDGVSVGARLVHGLRRTYHWLKNCFLTMELLGDMGHVESCFGLLGDNFSVGAR